MPDNMRTVQLLMDKDPVFKRFIVNTLGTDDAFGVLFEPGGIAKMNPSPPDVSTPASPNNAKKGPVKPAGKLKPVTAVKPVQPIKPVGAPKASRQPVAPSGVKASKPGVSDPSKVVKKLPSALRGASEDALISAGARDRIVAHAKGSAAAKEYAAGGSGQRIGALRRSADEAKGRLRRLRDAGAEDLPHAMSPQRRPRRAKGTRAVQLNVRSADNAARQANAAVREASQSQMLDAENRAIGAWKSHRSIGKSFRAFAREVSEGSAKADSPPAAPKPQPSAPEPQAAAPKPQAAPRAAPPPSPRNPMPPTPGRIRRTPILVALGAGTATAFAAHKAKKKAGEKWRGYKVVDNSLGKSEFGSEMVITKADDEKMQVFGWASVVTKDGVPVDDKQGDVIEPEEIEKAAYEYVKKSRKGGVQHKRTDDDQVFHVSDMIESMVFTQEKIEKMGLPETTPHGWWVGFQINDKDTWEGVKKRDKAFFSIHGRGRRVPLD